MPAALPWAAAIAPSAIRPIVTEPMAKPLAPSMKLTALTITKIQSAVPAIASQSGASQTPWPNGNVCTPPMAKVAQIESRANAMNLIGALSGRASSQKPMARNKQAKPTAMKSRRKPRNVISDQMPFGISAMRMRPVAKPMAMPRPPLVGVGDVCSWRSSEGRSTGPAAMRIRHATRLTKAAAAKPAMRSQTTRNPLAPGYECVVVWSSATEDCVCDPPIGALLLERVGDGLGGCAVVTEREHGGAAARKARRSGHACRRGAFG